MATVAEGPKFAESYSLTRAVGGRERKVVLMPCLLNCWWGAHSGPQTAEGIANDHLRTIDALIHDMILEGWISAASNDPIELTVDDWEREPLLAENDEEALSQPGGLRLQI